jgi:hypothetical protein
MGWYRICPSRRFSIQIGRGVYGLAILELWCVGAVFRGMAGLLSDFGVGIGVEFRVEWRLSELAWNRQKVPRLCEGADSVVLMAGGAGLRGRPCGN